jgi:hypothetical protein
MGEEEGMIMKEGGTAQNNRRTRRETGVKHRERYL